MSSPAEHSPKLQPLKPSAAPPQPESPSPPPSAGATTTSPVNTISNSTTNTSTNATATPPHSGVAPTRQKKKKAREAVGNYLLGDLLGHGQFGQVYRGVNSETGQFVAIKQLKSSALDAASLQAFQSEISLLSTFEHPNIVKYIGVVTTTDHVNLVLEFSDGGSLTDVIRKFGSFPEKLCARYIQQCLDGLVYLHSKGVVHRDIKCANILLTKSGQVKLADFGISTSNNESMEAGFGSPYWMAPEVIQMEVPPNEKADIWSLGCTVIELLTGNPPYHEYHPMGAIVKCVQDDHPPLPPKMSDELRSFLLKCFQKEVSQRATAKELSNHIWITNIKDEPKESKEIQTAAPTVTTTGAIRVYGSTIRSDTTFKTIFVTSLTTAEEVVQLALLKYNSSADPSTFALFEEGPGTSRLLEDSEVPLAIGGKWGKPDEYQFELKRRPIFQKHVEGVVKQFIVKKYLTIKVSTWEPRILVVDSEQKYIALFRGDKELKPYDEPIIVIYNLRSVDNVHEEQNDYKAGIFEFSLETRTTKYSFRSDTNEQMTSWISTIREMCAIPEGGRKEFERRMKNISLNPNRKSMMPGSVIPIGNHQYSHIANAENLDKYSTL